MTMGTLGILLESQKALQERTFGHDFANMTTEERVAFIAWNAYALEDEIHEATDEIGWKPWATSKHINRKEFVGEMVDALQFWMNMVLAVGVTEDEILERYKAKREVNVKRQMGGYDGIHGKDPITKRALDEPQQTICPTCELMIWDTVVHDCTGRPRPTTAGGNRFA